MAIDDPRVIAIDFTKDDSGLHMFPMLKRNPRLDILLACKAAKARVSKLQTPLFLEHSISENLHEGCYQEKRLVANPNVDTVWMVDMTYLYTFLIYKLPEEHSERHEKLQQVCTPNCHVKGVLSSARELSTPRRKAKSLAISKVTFEFMLGNDGVSTFMTEICKWGFEEVLVVVNGETEVGEPDVVFIPP